MGSSIIDLFETFVLGVTVIFLAGSVIIGLLAFIAKNLRGV
jgi:energy-converting hydrogenase Eha subunit E